jgi:hypothetical protein
LNWKGLKRCWIKLLYDTATTEDTVLFRGCRVIFIVEQLVTLRSITAAFSVVAVLNNAFGPPKRFALAVPTMLQAKINRTSI